MENQIKEVDYGFAYDIQNAQTDEEVIRLVKQALQRFGLKETSKQMKRRLIK